MADTGWDRVSLAVEECCKEVCTIIVDDLIDVRFENNEVVIVVMVR